MTKYEYRKNEIDEYVQKAIKCNDVDIRNTLLYVAQVEKDWLGNLTLAEVSEEI